MKSAKLSKIRHIDSSPDLHSQEDERINEIDLVTVVMHIVYAKLIGTKKKQNKPLSTNDNNSYFMCHSIMRCCFSKKKKNYEMLKR